MKFSLQWLREHLEGDPPADEMAARLTAAGMNVELQESSGDDVVWDVDVTTNRPDAMNHRGLAREAAAAGCGALKPLAIRLAESATPVDKLAGLTVEDRAGCPRYCARVVRGVKVGPSPAWLAERLERCGIRPINNVVDATNYVLLDVGQPLHAFELSRLAGSEIRVRRARVGERITTLDGADRTLTPEDLLIADAKRAVAIAGVMGGANTEIGPATKDVLIESAYFDPLSVRRTARRLGLSTEASRRFERGADPAMARTAVDLAADLIVRLGGGEVTAGVLDSAPVLPAPRTIQISIDRLSAFGGCEIGRDFVIEVLAALELAPQANGDSVVCTIPHHRVDLELPEDLYEEVLRHFGYENVPSALPSFAVSPGRRLGSWPLTERARDALVAVGAAEALTYTFSSEVLEGATSASPLADRGDAVRLENPLSARLAVLRRSLLAGLVDAASGNLRRDAERVLLGEVGRVFFARGSEIVEEERVALTLAGTTGAWDAVRATNFLDLKGLVESLLAYLGVGTTACTWQASTAQLLAPGEGADVTLGDRVVAVAGRLADPVAEAFEVPIPLWVAEVDLGAVAAERAPWFLPLPRFPAVMADLTARHKLSLSYAELMAAIRAAAPEWLEAVFPVVRYRGEGVGADEVKTTVRLVYRHPERSLTQEEVNAAHFVLMDTLARTLAVSFQ
jgi:phenylalanyl-tRNA synthetase beta chain